MNENLEFAAKELDAHLENGLNDFQIEERTKKYGRNLIETKKKTLFIVRFLKQFKDPMIILLLVAAIISLLIAFVPAFHSDTTITSTEKIVEKVEPFIIFLIVFINSFFGAFQENKAEKAVINLNKMIVMKSKVYRNGNFDVINSENLVPGDIVIVDAGDSVPADGIIIESNSLMTIESALTGESGVVEKLEDFISNVSTPIADRKNYLYSGTSVANGHAKFLVTKTGMNTEIGKIAKMLNTKQVSSSSIEKRIGKLSKILGIAAAILLIIIFLIYIFYVNNISEIAFTWANGFKIAISIAIAVIPEGLFAIMTVVFALGIKRMIKSNALIKKISTVETVGQVSVICSDKTGTLTQNKMEVINFYNDDHSNLSTNKLSDLSIIKYAILCNDTKDDDGVLVGDPTETALVSYGIKNQINFKQVIKDNPRIEEIPFDSDRKLMTTIHKIGNEYLVITKGAPDCLFALNKDLEKLSRFQSKNEEMSKQALRVLAIAIKKISKLPEEINSKTIEFDLNLVGLFGIIDPPRLESKNAIAALRNANIRTVMITGDHALTAQAIAKNLEIINSDYNDRVISGTELEQIDDSELKNVVKNYSVYARVSPNDKIRIVNAFKANKEVVGMIGDGVNDAAALKASDVGIAMGNIGTEVAKNAADMILTNDNFATIVKAVREGRGIIDNLKRIMLVLFTTNMCAVLTLLFGMLIFQFSPFTAIQILWINLVTESLPAIALGMKRPKENIMTFKPSYDLNLVSLNMFIKILLQGFLFSSIALTMFFVTSSSFVSFDYYKMITYFQNFELAVGTERDFTFNMQMAGSTAAFIFIATSQSFNAFNIFSNKSIFTYKFNEIKYVLLSFIASLFLIMIVVLIPQVNVVFNSNVYVFSEIIPNYSFGDYSYLFFIAFLFCFFPTLIIEILKLINNSKHFQNFLNKNYFLKRFSAKN